MSKARTLVVLIVIVAGLLTAAAVDGQLGTVLAVAFAVVFLGAGFVVLAMNTGQYEWGVDVIAKIVDPLVIRVRAFVRRAWPPA